MSLSRIGWSLATIAVIGVVVLLAAECVRSMSAISELETDKAYLEYEMDVAREKITLAQQERAAATDVVNNLVLANTEMKERLADADRGIADLEQDKVVLEAELTAEQVVTARLRQDKSVLESNLADAGAEIDSLTSLLYQTERQLGSAERDMGSLAADKESLGSELTAAHKTIGDLRRTSSAQQSRLTTLTAENLSLAAERDALSADLFGARSANANLIAENTEIERLHGSVESLRQQIYELKRQRQPLLLDTWRNNPLCTGSMEPKVTCLDALTMLSNFSPEDITVGSLIAFKPTEECKLVLDHVLHRVMEIKVEGGVHYYWPKGDANANPDDCWVPESNVSSYVIEIHKDVRPENAELRQAVLDAKALVVKARQDFHDYCDQWATSQTPDLCLFPKDKYEWSVYLVEVRTAAKEYLGCWLNVARTVKTVRDMDGEVRCELPTVEEPSA